MYTGAPHRDESAGWASSGTTCRFAARSHPIVEIMPRRATGSKPKWDESKGCWLGRISLVDGARPWIEVRDLPRSKQGERRAAEVIAHRNEVARAEKLIAADFGLKPRGSKSATTMKTGDGATSAASPKAESCDEWHLRFVEHRKSEVGSVDDDKWRWNKWISPLLGPKPIRSITPDDIENVRDALTAAVIAYEKSGSVTGDGRLAPKTSRNVWAALTTCMKYASTRKGPRELRVREDLGNPCIGIPPPRDGASKRRHWCRPGEIFAVLSCKDVPLSWREAVAVGCYLHLRPGELYELRVKDLDLESGEVAIRRAYDERTKSVKVPKTDEGIRSVTIPPALLPLLKRLQDEREPGDLIAPVIAATAEKSRAGIFRDFLKAAKVTRAELFEETETHLQIDFRSLRDSGITWRFLAEHRSEVVQREAGHEHISTTLGYAKEVQNRGGRYGEPFPALPRDLIDPKAPDLPPDSSGESSGGARHPRKSRRKGSGRRDLNPRPQAPKACALPGCATPRRNAPFIARRPAVRTAPFGVHRAWRRGRAPRRRPHLGGKGSSAPKAARLHAAGDGGAQGRSLAARRGRHGSHSHSGPVVGAGGAGSGGVGTAASAPASPASPSSAGLPASGTATGLPRMSPMMHLHTASSRQSPCSSRGPTKFATQPTA